MVMTPARLLAVGIFAALIGVAIWLQADRGPVAAFVLLLGGALGVVFQRARFCFHCILRDAINGTDTRPAMAILAALAVGSVGYTILFSVWVPSAFAGRLPPDAHIGPVSWVLVLAGFVFGLGMALSGSCISGHLYRLGEGSTRAPFALVGAFGGFVLGFMSWDRLYLMAIADAPVVWLPASLGYGGALAVQIAVLAAISLMLFRGMASRPAQPGGRATFAHLGAVLFRDRWNPVVGGSIVGVLGVAAYFRAEPLGVTAQIGSVARTAADGADLLNGRLLGLDTFAGCATAVVQAITDNGLLVSALVAGSLAAALAGGHFQPRRFPLRDYATALAGGLAMGWASMIALGCTVGTLLSGVMAFALSGWVFAVAVIAGVWSGLFLGRRLSALLPR